MGLNGRFVSYFASGNPYIKANYSHGISNGVQHTFYETGTLKHQVEFIQGFVYKQRWYYPSGKLQREHVPDIRIPKNPGRILFDRSFDEDGNLTKFEQYDYEKMLHHELRWYSSGAKRVLRVHRLGKNYGQIDSIDVAWYENGVKREETQFKYGYYHGERKSWFENGQMKSLETFYYGRKEGPEIEWEQDGTIKSKLNWCGSVGRHD